MVSLRSALIMVFQSVVLLPHNQVRGVMLFDSSFTVECGIQKTGIEQGLLISNSTRNLTVQCLSTQAADEWVSQIVKRMGNDE